MAQEGQTSVSKTQFFFVVVVDDDYMGGA